MEGRLNVHFYTAEYRELKKRLVARWSDIKRLDHYADVVCGPFGTEITLADYAKSGIPLLRISNIAADGTLDLSDVIFITSEKAAKLDSTQVVPGDLVISQRGTLGLVAVVDDAFPLYNISANLIAIRSVRGIEPRFLQQFLTCTPGAKQLERVQSGQVQAKITTEDVASILVPVPQTQRKLVAEMQAAREARKQNLGEAGELLASLDTYLLETLGLTPPPRDDRQIYAVRLKAIRRDNRLNADYYHPERILTLRTLQQTASTRLDALVTFHRDLRKADPSLNYLGLAHVQSHTGELVAADEEAEGQCFAFLPGDVLFARLRPYLNKVYRAEREGVCSTEFHVMRVNNPAALLPEYLATMLRSSLVVAQTRHMMTGNTHPRLTNDDVVNLVVPIPPLKVQQQIAAEVRGRREQARRLRSEADADWQAAKRRFEQQLLGTKRQ